MLDALIKLDRDIFLILNNSLANRFNDFLFGGLTLAGYLEYLLPITLLYLYFMDKNNFKRNSIILIAAVLTGGLLVNIIKELVDRPRPLKDLEPLLLTGKITVHNLFYAYRENSFPSGHTQAAFGTAAALIYLTQKHKIYLVLIAFLMGLSRIYVGVHFPLDVIFGAIIGVTISLSICKIADKYFANRQRNKSEM